MYVVQRHASGLIRPVVRAFAERRISLSGPPVAVPLPARSDQFIEIYFNDSYQISHNGQPAAPLPEMVLVGPHHYRRTRLYMSGEIHAFTIRFQPGGFHMLYALPMTELVDQGVAAADILGGGAAELQDAVRKAPDFDARVAAAERWIAARMAYASPPDPVSHGAALLARTRGQMRIDALARRTGLSDRQFTRRFASQVGLPPKLYARITRFNAVLAAKAALPQASWTDLAHDAGYADQAHFIRDCHALAGDAPSDFFPRWSPNGR